MVKGDLGFLRLPESDAFSSADDGAEGPEGIKGRTLPWPIPRNEPVNAGTEGGGCLARVRRGLLDVTTVIPLRPFLASVALASVVDCFAEAALDGTAFLEVVLRAVFLVSGALVGLAAIVADFLATDLMTFFVVDVLEDLAVGLVVCVDFADGALVFFLRLFVFEDVAGFAVLFLLVFFVAALVAALVVFAGFVFFPALEMCATPAAPDLVVFRVVFLDVFLDVFFPTLFAVREEAVF